MTELLQVLSLPEQSDEAAAPPARIAEILQGLSDASVAEALLESGLATPESIRQARIVQSQTSGAPLLGLMLRSGTLPEQSAVAAMAKWIGVPMISRERLAAMHVEMASACTALGITQAWCRDQRVAFIARSMGESPLQQSQNNSESGQQLTVVLAAIPTGVLREFLLQLPVRHSGPVVVALTAPTDFMAALEQAPTASTQVGSSLDLQHLKELAEEGPVVELVNSTLSRAVTMRASDVHLEPAEQGFVIRVRVDGNMRQMEKHLTIPYEAVVCRVKILSGMDIAERRLPQDGRLDARVNGISFDVRVSVIPMVKGESVVLRLLRQQRVPTSLNDLGMADADSDLLRRWLSLPNGLVLVTGPTGSGKSTTLYTAIDLLGQKTDKIVTVEDPVEYKLHGVSQIQVNAEIGLDFPQALRSILRHDPDVILIGEIRDALTAQIATQAALTGHLVLSTLHTNTSAGAVTRLLDMGVDSYLLADSLKGVMAQRLVRRLCPECKAPADEVSHALSGRITRLALDPSCITPMRSVGCKNCDQSGFAGRIGVYDLLSFDGDLTDMIRPGVTAREVELAAHTRQHTVPWSDGWRKVAAGETTAEEMLASTSESLSPEPADSRPEVKVH